MSTITSIAGSDRVTDSRSVINTNFSNLNTDKAEVTGNVATATALQTARTINGVSFDGTANIKVASTLRKNLVLHLPFDFACLAADDSNTRGATTISGATFEPTGGPDGDGDYSFNGTTDYIDTTHNANQLLVNGFSLSVWINVAGAGETAGGITGSRILDKSTANTAAGGFALILDSSGTGIRFSVNNGGTISASSTVTGSTWTHVLVTVSSAAAVTIYVNGSSVATGTTGALSGITTTNAIRVGNRAGATDKSFQGKIAKVRAYARVLTAAEIAELYTNQL